MDRILTEYFATVIPFSSSMIFKRFYPLGAIAKISPLELILNFSTMSNEQFKELLSTHPLNGSQSNFLHEFFHVEENVIGIRQIFHLINKLNYLRLQHEQWTHYYNLGLNEGIWNGGISFKMAQLNSMASMYGHPKHTIECRRKRFEEQLQYTLNELQQQEQSLTNIDTQQLMAIASDFIEADQYQLCLELERRRHVLVFDAKDHELVDIFYKLKPRDYEIRSAQLIWKATYSEQELRYELAIFKLWLSRTTSLSFHCSFQDLALRNINAIVARLLFDEQLSLASTTTTTTTTTTTATTTTATTIAAVLNSFNNDTTLRIHHIIQSLAQQTITAIETLANHYMNEILDEKEKLLDNLEKSKNPVLVHAIINAIGNRQVNMIQRAQYNTEQRLKAFSHNQS